MSDPVLPQQRVLRVDPTVSGNLELLKALASEPRIRILDLLSDQVCNVGEIAQALDMPASTATLHVSTLEGVGLVKSELQPGIRGLQKVCARVYDLILVELPRASRPSEQTLSISMPIGNFVDFQVTPTCGLASREGVIGHFDDPISFYEPERVGAQLLWFHRGYVTYHFPNRVPRSMVPDSLSLSMELCSEAPLHHDDWPSDITVWINEVEVGSWTSPADFSVPRGLLTPAWWEEWNTQYGLLKVWQVNQEASFVDGVRSSAVRIGELGLMDGPSISVRLGIKPDARHVGGINLFGRHFGNYPQDMVLRIDYH